MLNIKTLSIKNFLSVGNILQTVSFSNNELILVLGENLDMGGNDSKNGVGKSSIVNALSYVLFGTALTNIKRDNLINKTNAKNMFVTLDFEKDGIEYRIERGRKPGVFKFIKNNIELSKDSKEDDAQGENRHTQAEIERLLGFSHDMFKHIVALNTYVEPFLSLKANDQRIIIEQLLGITKLSDKAEKLKEELRKVKDDIRDQEFQVQAINEANKRINENIKTLENKSKEWEKKHESNLSSLQTVIMSLMEVNIEQEIENHKQIKDINELTREYNSLLKDLSTVDKEITAYNKQIALVERHLTSTHNKTCPVCEQEMGVDKHKEVHADYEKQVAELQSKVNEKKFKKHELQTVVDSIGPNIPALPVTFYDTIDEAYNHKSTLDMTGHSLENEINNINPFVDQIDNLKEHGLQVVDFTKINELVNLRDHMEFLLKLLTNKDSFIRKKIIDQNLTHLNHRLSHYLEKIGLPHIVKFKSDLEVEISLYGKDFDFDGLSRGERTRVILSLAWAFRDVYEQLYGKINLLFIDELLDNGLDGAGVDFSLQILKNMTRTNGKDIFLISHREELQSRVSSVLKVVKEGGFTTMMPVSADIV
jgi:DNA repair exonuclease SbcCD ATPase subunit